MQIDEGRLWSRLMTLGAIGAVGDGGVDRQALSAGEVEAWRLLAIWAGIAGLEIATDELANLYLTLPGRDRGAPPLLVGSHIDTQPRGGRFDGALGVVAGIEIVQTMADLGFEPVRDIVVVAWMNEEGSRFAPGMSGSDWFAGRRTAEEIRCSRDSSSEAAAGDTLGGALERFLQYFPDIVRRDPFVPFAYLELHIEQGPLLEAASLPIGVVTGIQGKTTWQVTISGERGHAGTLAMAERHDAVLAFARIASACEAAMVPFGPDIRFTIGRVLVAPNAPSIVPYNVVFSIDLRHPDNSVRARAAAAIEAALDAEARGCGVEACRLVDAQGVTFDMEIRTQIAQAATARGGASTPILSSAGHDARNLAPLCPSAMIFVPCRAGISHAPEEWASPEDCAAGAQILLDVAATMADYAPR